MEQFWTTIATCASAAAAFIALGISVHQTRLSNKQHLLDRRLSIWLAVQGLLELYGKNRALLKKDNEPQLGLDVVFSMLANNAHLCDIALAASHPLVEEYQRPFLVKLDELKRMALESAFVFKGRTGVAASAFLSSYQRLLFEIYQYCVLTDCMGKNARKFCQTLDQACEEVNESAQRRELYCAYDEISKAYAVICDDKMKKAIEKQIRLVR